MSLNRHDADYDIVLITTGLDSTLHSVARVFESIIPNSKYVRRSAHKYVSTLGVILHTMCIIVAKVLFCRDTNTAFVKFRNLLRIEGSPHFL